MIGKVILLLFLVVILAFGGILWFDFLNVIDARSVLAPIYRHIPVIGGEGRTQPRVAQDEFVNLDAERLAIRLKALELESIEMDMRARDLDFRQLHIEQMAMELEDRQQMLDERENSLRARALDAENRDRNVEQNARHLNGMPPERAVGILAMMEEQDAVDILRMTDQIAQTEGVLSIVPFWLSLMEPQRAADLQRRMAGRPASL